MTTIVMNTSNGAVTEYDWTGFQSVGPTRMAGAAGLFQQTGATTDNGAAIAAQFLGPRIARGKGLEKLRIGPVYFAAHGTANTAGRLLVGVSDTKTWEYPVPLGTSGVTRGVPGLGIRENELAIGFRNVAGADFRITIIAPDFIVSKQRKVF